jgi:iron complex outermembrane receptor protein
MGTATTRALICATLLLPTGSVLAAEDESKSGYIEEIIVTSTYRETNLMDTAQSISAVTASMVEDLGAQSMEDIFTSVAGLNMAGDRQGQNRYAVRGITSQTGHVGYFVTGATIGVYLDGTPVTSSIGPDNQLSGNTFDIERVEVLKGPQGTLFGEGSQGGTIRFLYKQPDTTAFDAAVNVSYANMEESDDNSSRIDAMVNIPLGDNWALRLTGWDSEQAGFIDNLIPDEPDFNTAETSGSRAVLKYEADNFSVTGSYYLQDQETFGNAATFAGASPFEASSNRVPGLEPFNRDKTAVYSFTVDVDFDWANFQSMTSYVDRTTTATVETSAAGYLGLDLYYGGSAAAGGHPSCMSATPHAYCPGGVFGAAGWPGFWNQATPGATIADGGNLVGFNGFIDSYTKRAVQEFRLVSPGDKRLRWTAGLFWKDSEDLSGSKQLGLYAPGREAFEALFDPLLAVPANTHIDELEEFAIFGEVSYDLTDQLELTAGLRLSDLHQNFRNTNQTTDDNPVAPKVVLSWRPNDDLLVYFNYAKGFRPGNINGHMNFVATQYQGLIAAAAACGGSCGGGLSVDQLEFEVDQALSRYLYDGDEVGSYEVGVKTTFFNGRMQLSGALYVIDWKDMIVVHRDVLISNPLGIYNHNSGGAEIKGFELNATAFLTERLSVTVAGDYNDTEVTTGSDEGASTAVAYYSPAGNEMSYSPPYTVSVMVDYMVPFNNGWSMDLHADYAKVDDQWLDAGNITALPGYDKVGARATVRSADQKWRVALFATNLTNEEILRNRQGSNYYWQAPRQIGLEIGYKM